MVDDLEIAKRAQAAVAVSTQGSSFLVPPVQSTSSTATVTDAIHLSASAADIITQLRASKTIAEAWLQQKIKTPDLTDPDSLHTKRNLFANINTGKAEDGDKAGQRSLSRSFTAAMNDISWLIDALGVGTFDVSRVAEVVAHRAVSDNVGVTPPISTAILQAEQSGSTAALYLEGLSITVQKGKTVDASVDRVTITTINPGMSGSFTGTGRPMVLDVGGELQQIAAPAIDESGNDVVATQKARATQAAKVAEILLATSMQRADAPRHALLVVREGGKLHPEGTMKLKMDVFQPIR